MKALAREPDRRYATVSELAADVESYLNVEPIQAGPPSTRYRVRKFVQKHRVGFAVAATILLILVAGLVVSSALYLQAAARAREIGRQADLYQLDTFRRKAETEFWPVHPDRVSTMEHWVAEVETIIGRLPIYERAFKEIQDKAIEYNTQDSWDVQEQAKNIQYSEQCLYNKRKQLEKLERVNDSQTVRTREQLNREIEKLHNDILDLKKTSLLRPRPVFNNQTEQWKYNVLDLLVQRIRGLRTMEPVTSVLACVKKRIEDARRIHQTSLASSTAKKAWRVAIQDIARLPVYQGMPPLEPQYGLVPLGRDPHSGLWEFWHMPSGERPRKRSVSGPDDPAGPSRWLLEDNTGMVLVLVPGGRFRMGAVRHGNPSQTNVDLDACPNESPVHEVELAPYFLSKYETTQGQWTGMLRSWAQADISLRANRCFFKETLERSGTWTLLNPVEQVNHSNAHEILRRWGLRLPTEAEWEYAARAGTTTPWWTGQTASSLKGATNLADLEFRGQETGEYESWSDGYWGTAPVGGFPPNPWGLFDMLGNVSEWCQDGQLSYEDPTQAGNGLRLGLNSLSKVQRGGSWKKTAPYARSSYRGSGPQKGADIGFRAARSIQ